MDVVYPHCNKYPWLFVNRYQGITIDGYQGIFGISIERYWIYSKRFFSFNSSFKRNCHQISIQQHNKGNKNIE